MIRSTPYFIKKNIYKLGEFKTENEKKQYGQVFDKLAVRYLNKLVDIDREECGEIKILLNENYINIEKVHEKHLYTFLIKSSYKPHKCQFDWVDYFKNEYIDFEEIWESLQNSIISEKTRTLIWEEIHLSFYNTYWFHKAYNTTDICPLCLTQSLSRMHFLLDCGVTKKLWADLEKLLKSISDKPFSPYEMCFGLIKKNRGDEIRNYLTFKLRESIVKQERISHNKPGLDNIKLIKKRVNEEVCKEIIYNYYVFKKENNLTKFNEIYNDHVVFLDMGKENKVKVMKIFDI